MLAFFYFSLFCFGAIFGSFSTVLIARWKTGERWILTGRSHCPKCGNFLTWKELIPIFSWVFQKGRCAHCGEKIPKTYPIIELIMGLGFMFAGFVYTKFFGDFTSNGMFENFHVIPFLSLIFLIFITIIYIVYDIFYLEIPDESFFLWIVWWIILFILAIFFGFENIFFDAGYSMNFHTFLTDKFLAIIILYSFLFLQILIPWTIFLWKNHRKKEILELGGLYFIFPFVVLYDTVKYKIFHFPRKNSEEGLDIPAWIGAGDLLLAIMIGGTLGILHGVVAFFVAYFSGSIVGLLLLFLGKSHPEAQEDRKEIPFGPFLGVGFLFALAFYEEIIFFAKEYFFF